LIDTSDVGLTGFDFPVTPLVRRIYTEEIDKDMDVWLKVIPILVKGALTRDF
jgi:hypothetical protein